MHGVGVSCVNALSEHLKATVYREGKIFEQEQIAQAVKLGIGVASPDQIEFLTDDGASAEYAARIDAAHFDDLVGRRAQKCAVVRGDEVAQIGTA